MEGRTTDYRLQAAYGRKKPAPAALERVTYAPDCYAIYLSAAAVWMAEDSLELYRELFIKLRVLSHHEPEWHIEITRMLCRTERLYEQLIRNWATAVKEEIGMGKDYLKEIEAELMSLGRMDIPVVQGQDHPSNELIIEIKEAVQKGNRTNFKLIQELQQKLEELAEGAAGGQQEDASVSGQAAERQIKELTGLLLETFDLLDLVRVSAQGKADEQWNKELEQVVDKALGMLYHYGLEEIHVQGQLFDGEYMEGISRVSLEELPTGYRRYEVFAVTQRGFIYRHTGKLIRKAKVTTVY